MSDHVISFPSAFRFLTQFPARASSAPDQQRSFSAVAAMAAQITAPGRWIPEELERDLFARLAGADTSTALASMQSWWQDQHLPLVVLDTTLDPDHVRQVLERMNTLNMAQILVVADETPLKTIDGRVLHSWVDGTTTLPGSHALLRVGFSEGQGAGLYFDPAAGGFAQPLPLSWNEAIVPAGLLGCLAVMPAGISQPPQDFDWLTQDWPIKHPQPDLDAIQKAVAAAQAEMEAHDAAVKTSLAAVLAEATKGGQA